MTKPAKPNAPIELTRLLYQDDVGALAVDVYVEIKNESSVDMLEARFGLSDDSGAGDPIVKEIRFGRIASGSSDRKTESFPTGIEKVLYTIKMADGNEYSGGGLGDNAPGVTLTITDP